MKITSLLFLSLIAFSSCKKSSNSPSPATTTTTQSTPGFQAKAGGVLWKASAFGLSSNLLYGETTDTSIVFNQAFTATGTYPLSSYAGAFSINITANNPNNVFFITSGTITITKYDATNKLSSGTFSFAGQSLTSATVQITDGVFTNIPIQ